MNGAYEVLCSLIVAENVCYIRLQSLLRSWNDRRWLRKTKLRKFLMSGVQFRVIWSRSYQFFLLPFSWLDYTYDKNRNTWNRSDVFIFEVGNLLICQSSWEFLLVVDGAIIGRCLWWLNEVSWCIDLISLCLLKLAVYDRSQLILS